jgi:hypothetical protein
MLETAPPEGRRNKLIQCLDAEGMEEDKGMKVIGKGRRGNEW